MQQLCGDVLQRSELEYAGVVHQDIEPPERLERLREETYDVFLLRHIGLHSDGLTALLDDLRHHTLRAFPARCVVDDNRRTLRRQRYRCRCPWMPP